MPERRAVDIVRVEDEQWLVCLCHLGAACTGQSGTESDQTRLTGSGN